MAVLVMFMTFRKHPCDVCVCVYMKSSDPKAFKCHLKFCSRMTIFIKLVY